jgi:SapC protein
MVKIVPVDPERHAGKGWRRPASYDFAATESVVPLGGSEFAHAVSAMPIGFVERAGHYLPVALMAVTKGCNVFVGPTGQWLGGYVPVVLRGYPFSLVRFEGAEPATLGIDEDSGLIVDDAGENVEKFFEPDGRPSAATNVITEFLRRLEHDQTITDLATAALAEAGVIKPWPLTVQVGNQHISVSGLCRVDEPALNALDDKTFLKLRKASALVVAHGQLMSMNQVSVLSRLAFIQQQMAQSSQASA